MAHRFNIVCALAAIVLAAGSAPAQERITFLYPSPDGNFFDISEHGFQNVKPLKGK